MTDDVRPLLVFFSHERSGPARRMESLLAHIARKERSRLRVTRVDVEERSDLAERFRVAEVPVQTPLFVGQDGHEGRGL